MESEKNDVLEAYAKSWGHNNSKQKIKYTGKLIKDIDKINQVSYYGYRAPRYSRRCYSFVSALRHPFGDNPECIFDKILFFVARRKSSRWNWNVKSWNGVT